VDSLYKKILDIIQNEATCLEEFFNLLVNQQTYLVESDLENLKAGVARQQEIIDQVKNLEKSRLQIIAHFSGQAQLDPKDVTISSLARKAQGEIANQLLNLQTNILSLHGKIEKAKRKNQFLIEHSMKYIEETIKLIAEKGKPRPDYAPHDKQESLILSRTV